MGNGVEMTQPAMHGRRMLFQAECQQPEQAEYLDDHSSDGASATVPAASVTTAVRYGKYPP
jgi:hypothetical protein